MTTVKPRRLFAAVYDRQLRGVERGWLGQSRAALAGALTGEVLEVGAGTGANLAHYRHATRVVACEPDPAMRARLARKLPTARVAVELCDASAEALPFADQSFDAVVCMLVLCTVAQPARALAEIGRVLRPGGRLAFLEHVRAQGRLARWQDRLTPLQVRLSGCHLNRDSQAAIAAAGFTIEHLEVLRPRSSFLTQPFIQGIATPSTPRRPD
jgi:ubiquinone/menaquinone biosynthesis C-methylase UbiE